MSFRTVLLLSLFATAPLVVADAEAAPKKGQTSGSEEAKYPVIEMTGIAQFDEVFTPAKSIQDTLDGQKKELTDARTQLNTALGLATDSPVKAAIEDLKGKAEGKIKVAMNGNTPKLEATEAVPENVQAGIDAVNKLMAACQNTVAAGRDLSAQAQDLISKASAFPGQVPSVVTGDPVAAAKALKQVNANLKAMGTTPERLKMLGNEAMAIINDVRSTFGA